IPFSGAHNDWADIQDSDVNAGGTIGLSAEAHETIISITAAIGAAQSGMAAALAMSINSISPNSQAFIQRKKTKGIQAGGTISLGAHDDSTIFALAGAGSGRSGGNAAGRRRP